MLKKIFLHFVFFLFANFVTTAQTLSPDAKLYDDSPIAIINITMDSSAFIWMMANPKIDSLHHCTFSFKNKFIDTTLTTTAIRLRGNTSRDAKKKSLKISFNTFLKGGEFYGVDKLNLNGEHNDPSISRAKISWDIFNELGITASRAAHAAVYINNEFMGVYVSVEHIDDEFLKKNYNDDSGNLWKCLYPADLTYKGDSPSLYFYSNNFPAYELSTNETKNDYSQLVRLIKIINQTSGNTFADSIEKVFHVSEYLKYQAVNILVGSWDSYYSLMNNYYLYHEPNKDKFHWIPYDYDNTFGIDWFSTNWMAANPYSFPKAVNGNRPLNDKLLANNQYKDLYTHFIQFFRSTVINNDSLNSRIDSIKNRVKSFAYLDTYKSKDYGFTNTDFDNSFQTQSNQHVKRGIKEFISGRNTSIASQLSFVGAAPIIYDIQASSLTPAADENVTINVAAFSSLGIDSVRIVVTDKNNAAIGSYAMNFSPVLGTKIVEEADRWSVTLPALGNNMLWKIKFYVYDKNKIVSVYPRTEPIILRTPSTDVSGIVINEFMADNTSFITDPNNEYEDWIELYNPTEDPVLLTGLYLTDSKTAPMKSKIMYPNLIIHPKEYLIFWADEDMNQDGYHANFKLSKSGEFVGLTASDGISWIDSVTFSAQESNKSYGRILNDPNNWKIMSPTPGFANEGSVEIQDYKNFPNTISLTSYPNPFNPDTKITYHLSVNSNVKLSVFDLLGRELKILVNQKKEAGTHHVSFNGTNFSSGIYFCRLITENQTQVIKLILSK